MNPSTLSTMRPKSPALNLLEEDSPADGGGGLRNASFRAELDPDPPYAPYMKITARSRHPTGQDQQSSNRQGLPLNDPSSPRVPERERSGSWGGVDESQEDLRIQLQQEQQQHQPEDASPPAPEGVPPIPAHGDA